MNPHQARAAAEMTGELLSDFGLAVFNGHVPPRGAVLLLWLVELATGIPLWRHVAWFIDRYPGTGLFLTGVWILAAAVTLGVTAAYLWAPDPQSRDHDLPSNER